MFHVSLRNLGLRQCKLIDIVRNYLFLFCGYEVLYILHSFKYMLLVFSCTRYCAAVFAIERNTKLFTDVSSARMKCSSQRNAMYCINQTWISLILLHGTRTTLSRLTLLLHQLEISSSNEIVIRLIVIKIHSVNETRDCWRGDAGCRGFLIR